MTKGITIRRVSVAAVVTSMVACVAYWIVEVREQNVSVPIYGNSVYFSVHLRNLPHIRLLDLRTSELSHVDVSQSGKKILILFVTAADCPSCFGEFPAWKELADKVSPSAFEEDIVFVRSSIDETTSVVSEGLFSRRANIYLDVGREADSSLHLPPDTPVTVLIEGGSRRVLAAEGKDNGQTSEETFISRVESFLFCSPTHVITLTRKE